MSCFLFVVCLVVLHSLCPPPSPIFAAAEILIMPALNNSLCFFDAARLVPRSTQAAAADGAQQEDVSTDVSSLEFITRYHTPVPLLSIVWCPSDRIVVGHGSDPQVCRALHITSGGISLVLCPRERCAAGILLEGHNVLCRDPAKGGAARPHRHAVWPHRHHP